MQTFMILLSALFFMAVNATHAHNHAWAHGVDRRGVQTEVIVVTEFVTETVTVLPSVATPTTLEVLTLTTPAAAEKATPALPSVAPPSNGGGVENPFKALTPKPNAAIVVNSCDYPVYIWSAGNPSCGPGTECQRIEPNSTYEETLRNCQSGGVSLKISKTEDASRPTQFEYSIWEDKTQVSYDISYLNCMKNSNGEQDLSECAGHDGGIQAVGGGNCNSYHCIANEWCDTMAYVVEEYGYKPGAPVGACPPDQGIAFELCAGLR